MNVVRHPSAAAEDGVRNAPSRPVATFEIAYRQYLDQNGDAVADLPGFARNPDILIPIYRTMMLTRLFDAPKVADLAQAVEEAADPADLWSDVQSFVQRHGGVEFAYERAHHYGNLAREAIKSVHVAPQQEILSTAAEYVLGRLH